MVAEGQRGEGARRGAGYLRFGRPLCGREAGLPLKGRDLFRDLEIKRTIYAKLPDMRTYEI